MRHIADENLTFFTTHYQVKFALMPGRKSIFTVGQACLFSGTIVVPDIVPPYTGAVRHTSGFPDSVSVRIIDIVSYTRGIDNIKILKNVYSISLLFLM